MPDFLLLLHCRSAILRRHFIKKRFFMPDTFEHRRIDFSFYAILSGMILLVGILPLFPAALLNGIPFSLRLFLGSWPLQGLYIWIAVYGAKKFAPGIPVFQTLDLKKSTPVSFLRILFAVPVLYLLLSLGTAFYVFLLKKAGFTLPPQSTVLLLKNGSPETLRILLPAALLAAPLGEELAFRHIIYKKFSTLFSPVEAAVLSALFFSAAHLNIQSFPALFFLGMYLSYLYRKSGSLLPCILTHALFNAISVGILILMRFRLLPVMQ
jgi:membrane protease YdiL (CAAX protease family)